MSDPATTLAALGAKSLFDAAPQVVSSVTQAYVVKRQLNAATFHHYIEASNPSLRALYAAIVELSNGVDRHTEAFFELTNRAQRILEINMTHAHTEAERACIRRDAMELLDKARHELEKNRNFKFFAGGVLGSVAMAGLFLTAKGVRKAVIKV